MVEEKPIAQQRLFTGHLVAVDELTVKLDNQQTAKREIVRAHPAAGVLALKDQRALFVSQFRSTVGQLTLEIPAGKIAPGEMPLAAAQRELNEETGDAGARLATVGKLFSVTRFFRCNHGTFFSASRHNR